MKRVEFVTLSAAHKHVLSGKPRNNGYVSFGALQALCLADGRKPKQTQGWTFVGDWKKSVAPYYHAH